MPFIGAFVGIGIAYVIYGISCAAIYLSYRFAKRFGVAPHIQKKAVLTLFLLAMLGYFVAVCVVEWDAVRGYFSTVSSIPSLISIIFMPCVYPILVLSGNAPYVENMATVQPLYITLWAFTLFVICLYIYAEWLQGGAGTAYYNVTYDMETGHEVSRRAVSYSEVYTWQNILGLLLLVFSLLTWPPIAIIVLLVRMYGWDYLC
jgi:hypothetical protein